jgi:hypothetical protein
VSTSTTSSKSFHISNQDDKEKIEESTMVTSDFIKKNEEKNLG